MFLSFFEGALAPMKWDSKIYFNQKKCNGEPKVLDRSTDEIFKGHVCIEQKKIYPV